MRGYSAGIYETAAIHTAAARSTGDRFKRAIRLSGAGKFHVNNVLKNDISSCIKVLEEIPNELQKKIEVGPRAAEQRDFLSKRGHDMKEVEREEGMLKRQLMRWEERIEVVSTGSDEKAREAKEKMKGLRREHSISRKCGRKQGGKWRERG